MAGTTCLLAAASTSVPLLCAGAQQRRLHASSTSFATLCGKWSAKSPALRYRSLLQHGTSHQSERCRRKIPSVRMRAEEKQSESPVPSEFVWQAVQRKAVVPLVAAGVAVTLLGGAVPSASAADALKTCQCLLQNCAAQLAECLENPGCAANIACLQTCNGRPDETECQIKCGDLFQNAVVDDFNKCAVSDKGCVPQKPDEGLFPEPKPDAIVQAFDTSKFTGKWYISSGLNSIFDTFDCQLHEFDAPGPQQVVGNLTWRIDTPDGGFFTRSAVQKFKQDPQKPGILYNHGNEFLHYEDDWYIVSSKIEDTPEDYVFVYYRGRNDAWTGYGGAVVYTRAKTLPESIIPELKEGAQRVGLDWNKFRTTDNTCGPQQPLVYRLATKVKTGFETLVQSLENEEKELERIIEEDERLLLTELDKDEKKLLNRLNMRAYEVEQLFKGGLPAGRGASK